MKAKIKSVDLNSSIGVFEYEPTSADCFSIWMTFAIGSVDSLGADYFRLRVCTPKWLNENETAISWGRHTLLVDSYRPQDIVDFVDQYVSALNEKNWMSLAAKISRVLQWEFEDYSSSQVG